MTDDNFEKFLRGAAESHNVPPVKTPKEEVWKAIEAKRAAGPKVVYGGGSVGVTTARRFESKVWWGAAAAGLVLVASGVGIGRWSASPGQPTRSAVIAQRAASITESPNTASPEGSVGANSSPVDASQSLPTDVAKAGASERGFTQPRVRPTQVASAECTLIRGCDDRSNVAAPDAALPRPGSNSAYQLVAARHLTDAEALLTSFRSRSAADQQVDAQMGTWARELLTNTRLILDSPIGSDPHRRPLLEDLELVLVQIVQLSPGSTSEDRDLIEKTLQHDHVLTRLRTAIPAGAQRGS